MVQKIDEDIEIHNKRSSNGRRPYDSLNIVQLVQKQTNPSVEAVAAARQLLALTEQGKVTVFSYAALGSEGTVSGIAGLEDKYRNTMRGVLLALANEV